MIERMEFQVFVAVAKHLNFALAAKELRLSAPQISKVIASLEDKVKKKLFVRSTRQVQLSDCGQMLLAAANQALTSFQDAENIFLDHEDDANLQGVIRVTCAHTLGIRAVAKMTEEFHQSYPLIKFNFLLSDAYINMIEEGIDLAIRVMVPEDSSLIAKRLADNPIVFCASPRYLAKSRPIKTVQDLTDHDVFYIPQHANLEFRKTKNKLSEVARCSWASANNGDFLTELAKNNAGLAVRAKWSIEKELSDGDLVELKLNDGLVSHSSIYAVYPANRFMPRRLRLWIEHLVISFKTDWGHTRV